MQNLIKINHLTRKQKLMVMEAIWEDLLRDDEPAKSPEWHKQELQETEQRYKVGEEKILDWQETKKELRKRFE